MGLGTVDYHLLYGDIKLTLEQEFLGFEIYAKDKSYGDLLVFPESASDIPGIEGEKTYAFTDDYTIDLSTVIKDSGADLDFTLPMASSLRFMHLFIMQQPEVMSRIAHILSSGSGGGW